MLLSLVFLFGLSGSKCQSVVLSKDESAKYLNAIDFAFDQIKKLPNGKSDGKYWSSDSCTVGTNGTVIDKIRYTVSVEKKVKKVDGSVISNITFCSRSNNVKTENYPLEIIYFSYNHETQIGAISWIIKNSADEPFKIHVGGNKTQEKINDFLDHLDKYISR